MPKLIMKLDDRVAKEVVFETSATIGRLPDNTVMIDNPAISSHHARIFHDGDRFVVEDLNSKNGTFVNGKLVLNRRSLQTGDIVLVGKHELVFDEAVLVDGAEAVLEELGETVYLDTEGHRELLARLRAIRWAKKPPAEGANEPRADAAIEQAVAQPPVVGVAQPPKVGVLRVVAGAAPLPEYALESNIALIGTSQQALVRLRGWFKPKVAVGIVRYDGGYVATPYGGKPQINNQPLRGRHNLKEGDVLDVNGLILEFRWSA
jgi:pSer/pThr/pTyr-binding forkhead associated (FHA) protein